MAVLCRFLTAVALVVHLTVGCCAHHAHACEGKGRLSPVRSDAAPDGQRPESGSDHSHHGANDCRGSKCSSVSDGRSVGDSFVPRFQASFAVVLDAPPSLVGFNHEQCTLSSGRLLLPVRLHLADQVLLI